MREAWMPAVAAVLIAAAIAGGVIVTSEPTPTASAAAAQPSPVNTAQVRRTTLSATVSVAGTLTFRARPDGEPYSAINQARGTYTKLPAPGQVIPEGHILYRVNDRPVVLLRGSTPTYRTLSAGATGADVVELNADLVALGYATSAQLHPRSAFFGPSTTAALKKLQGAVGLARSGTLTFGQAVFEPAAIRVTSLPGQVGARARPGQTVLQGTSTTRQVQVALDASQQTEVAVADKVTITLPDNRTTPGAVSSVGTVATCPPSPESGSGSGSVAPETGTCSSGGASATTPTIAVNVTPRDPSATGAWDQAPVQVGITTATVHNALVVPVTALLARSGGGYAVEAVGAGQINRLVPVSLGLFDDADGLVQVTGPGLAPGQQVVVPAT